MALLAWQTVSNWCVRTACGRYSVSIVMPAMKGQKFIVTVWDARCRPHEVIAELQSPDKQIALNEARRFCQDREDLKGVAR